VAGELIGVPAAPCDNYLLLAATVRGSLGKAARGEAGDGAASPATQPWGKTVAIVQKLQREGSQLEKVKQPTGGVAVTNEKIAARAYEIWRANGCPQGRDKENWLQAERELRSGKH
jgi:Protein of unknown function (DUF2934)